jgi:hypothetical protein
MLRWTPWRVSFGTSETKRSFDGKIKAARRCGPLGVVSVCLHIVLDGTAAAPHEVTWCRSDRKIVQNQRSERHRSQCSVLLRVLGGRMSGHDRMEGRCRTNGAPSRLALRATGSAGLRP